MKHSAINTGQDCFVSSRDAAGSIVPGSLDGVLSRNSMLATVYREHHQSLVSFLSFKLKSKSEASDIAQEAYARVLRHGFPNNIECPRSYVFKTANNLAINRLIERQRKRDYLTFDPKDTVEPSGGPTPEDNVQCQQKLQSLIDAVEELPKKCRMAFVMYKFEFLEYREIAERMELTESMIRKYVLKGLRHCQDRLEDLSNEAPK